MPKATSVTIMGGGNTAFAVAANLAMHGASVRLCELPAYGAAIEPIAASRQIRLDGVAGQGRARLACVTSDFAEALADVELVLVIVPAYGHRPFAEACAAHLRPGQVVVLMPGTLGSLQFARILADLGGADGVVVAETDTAAYVCRKVAPDAAHIWGVVKGLGLGVLPASQGQRVGKLMDRWFPGVRLYANVVAAGLAAMNPVVHPAGVLLNAGRLEYARGEFYFYEEGVTPSVCRLIEAVDRERLAIAAALGIDLPAASEAFWLAGFGPRGDLWSTINGSRMLTQLRAPGTLATRWLTEDVPFGLAAWFRLGQQLQVACPVMGAVVDLASATLQIDFWASARSPQDLGIAGMDKDALIRHVA